MTTATASSLDVICFGESMVLFAAETAGPLDAAERFTRRLCGADSNVAIGLGRLGFNVHFLSRVGNDAFGRYIRDALSAEGIDVSGVYVDPVRPTGIMFKSRSEDGSDPQTVYRRAGSAASALAPEDLDAERIGAARHLHVTGITAALSASALRLCEHAMTAMRAAGGTVSFDPNLRPALWTDRARMVQMVNALAARADWLLAGHGEAEQLTGATDIEAMADFYLAAGVSEVVIKRGAAGAALRTRDLALAVPAVPVARVVDTVGAGDGFAVGFLSARLEGLSPQAALERGNAFGALAVQHVGDYEGLPHAWPPAQPAAMLDHRS